MTEEVWPGLGFKAKSLEQEAGNFLSYQTARSDFIWQYNWNMAKLKILAKDV